MFHCEVFPAYSSKILLFSVNKGEHLADYYTHLALRKFDVFGIVVVVIVLFYNLLDIIM